MKRLILTAALLLTTSTAQADIFPAGCYVADYYRTDSCWGEDLSYFSWYNYEYSNPSGENNYYGKAVATLLQQETTYRLNYEVVAKDLKKQKDLVKKLKRKCGGACRGAR